MIALASTVGARLDGVTFGGLLGEGVVTLVLVFWTFGWFFPARIIRAKVLSLREKEFVEAALMTGASDWRIMRSHLLPHLVAPIIVFSTLAVAGFVLFEAALSFLGVGIKLPTPSWGNLLAGAPELHHPAVAAPLARAGRDPDDARLQPARRRAPRRLRSARAPVAQPRHSNLHL